MQSYPAPSRSNIAVLASGGVDSSIALHLLRQQGHSVTAFYLKVWMEGETVLGNCPWREDAEYVQKIADQIGVPFEIFAMQREYWDLIIDYTLREVKAGRTPNPAMMCNKLFKFGAFYDLAGKDYDLIASGHYAKTVRDEQGSVRLLTSMDPKKDQTYFLSQMSRDQLSRSVFPLGDLNKSQVRILAKELNLANAERPDSQGICFLGKINYRDFISRHVGRKTGRIIEQSTGRILGDHEGFWFYTIGQRNGLRLSGGPWFVVDKDGPENIIYVAHGYDPDQVYRDRIDVKAFNWISPLKDTFLKASAPGNLGSTDELPVLSCKIRHTPEFFHARIQFRDAESLTIWPEEKVGGVAKGQFAVLYQGRECLGGGVID
jgi:tRNA (5-methylaminomethyl-2-thiouridylate)-methyltransferase